MRDIDIAKRERMVSAGVTGARLYRLTLADGSELIEKIVDRSSDWLMRATGDDGRIHRLWCDGVFAALPPGIDTAMEDVRPIDGGWSVLMRDVGPSLVVDGEPISRAQSQRMFAAASSIHTAFAGTHIESLCPIVDRIRFLTRPAIRAIPDHPHAGIILPGWDRFAEAAPADVGRAVLALAEDPEPLAAALASFPSTLLHGDLKMSNLGFRDDAVVLLDWGTLTCIGPPALELAWYLAINSSAVDATLDEMRADAEAVLGPEGQEALPLALLAQVVLLGWEKALGATSKHAAVREREHAGLLWWCERAAEALDRWPLA